jgi:hypothetical protein
VAFILAESRVLTAESLLKKKPLGFSRPCGIQPLGKAGFLPGGRVLADRLFLFGIVDNGIQLRKRAFRLLQLTRFQAVAELLQSRSQAGSIASIGISMLQILSVCLKSRRVISHPE